MGCEWRRGAAAVVACCLPLWLGVGGLRGQRKRSRHGRFRGGAQGRRVLGWRGLGGAARLLRAGRADARQEGLAFLNGIENR